MEKEKRHDGDECDGRILLYVPELAGGAVVRVIATMVVAFNLASDARQAEWILEFTHFLNNKVHFTLMNKG